MSKRTTILISIALVQFMIVLLFGVAANVLNSPASTTTLVAAQAITTGNISATTAGQIAQQAVPGATLNGTPTLVNLQGTVAYQVQLDRGVVYVNATTGQILYNQATALSGQNTGRSRRSGTQNDSNENQIQGQED